MKTWTSGIVIACLMLGPGLARGAASTVEGVAEISQAIRILEGREVQAVLARDGATLEELWDRNFVVHNPEGRIVPAGATVLARPVFQGARASFVRNVESIVVQGDVAISMGSETVVPIVEGRPGPEIKRRYTNVWMRKGDSWKLVARHANNVCDKE
ncbi:MAG TPA: nuclear transport factor 2 family protein [Opitutaceae bacterium]|nr:nuclear transport factor 2 family protein [Opitutaceae bacterium]